jgi:hypothetical protein
MAVVPVWVSLDPLRRRIPAQGLHQARPGVQPRGLHQCQGLLLPSEFTFGGEYVQVIGEAAPVTFLG